MALLPTTEGHYKLLDYTGVSYWDVYFNKIDGKAWAYNGEQRDPCSWLGNADCTEKWEKVSDYFKYLS